MISYTNADAVEQIASAIEAGAILLGRRATCGRYKLAVDDYDGFAVIPTSRTQAQESEHRDAADAAIRFIWIEGEYNALIATARAIEEPQ